MIVDPSAIEPVNCYKFLLGQLHRDQLLSSRTPAWMASTTWRRSVSSPRSVLTRR